MTLSLPVLILPFWHYLTNLPLGFSFFACPVSQWFDLFFVFPLAFHQHPLFSFYSHSFLGVSPRFTVLLRYYGLRRPNRLSSKLSFVDVGIRYPHSCWKSLFVQQSLIFSGSGRPDLLFPDLSFFCLLYSSYQEEVNGTKSTQPFKPETSPSFLSPPFFLILQIHLVPKPCWFCFINISWIPSYYDWSTWTPGY